MSKRIIELVDRIYLEVEKGENPVRFLREIDQIVYELYELTEEEIRIVEGA